MQRFTADRHADTPDELWLTSHPPVFTQGQGGKPEHLLRDTGIPVVKDDAEPKKAAPRRAPAKKAPAKRAPRADKGE